MKLKPLCLSCGTRLESEYADCACSDRKGQCDSGSLTEDEREGSRDSEPGDMSGGQ